MWRWHKVGNILYAAFVASCPLHTLSPPTLHVEKYWFLFLKISPWPPLFRRSSASPYSLLFSHALSWCIHCWRKPSVRLHIFPPTTSNPRKCSPRRSIPDVTLFVSLSCHRELSFSRGVGGCNTRVQSDKKCWDRFGWGYIYIEWVWDNNIQ